MAALDDLPPELIDNVASNLGSSLLQFRLVCRKYNLDSLHAYKTVFFSAKRFTIYRSSSLQAMVEIANHEVLGPALETLILGTDHYSANAFSSIKTKPLVEAQHSEEVGRMLL